MKKYNFEVDVVITWVCSSDIKWLKKKNSYIKRYNSNIVDAREIRYRDWGFLKYILRGIEKFAPWVRKIFLVVDDQCPSWINKKSHKLRIVNHKDFMPEKYLPTFSCNPLELNFHRIKDLSEHFIYFNDDMFLINKTKKSDFFDRNGLPKYPAIEKAPNLNFNKIFCNIITNNINVINSLFEKKKVKHSNVKKWYFQGPVSFFVNIINDLLAPESFIGLYSEHIPSPFLKSEINNCWKECYDVLNETSLNKFRTSNDVNQYLFKYYLICKNKFCAVRPWILWDKKTLCAPLDLICKTIKNPRKKILCINDENQYDFCKEKPLIQESFDKLFPDKSNFEK